MNDLFAIDESADSATGRPAEPLPDRLRPKTLDAVVGQDHLVGPDGKLTRLLAASKGGLPSLILWGPPGTGKTTIARLLRGAAGEATRFVQLSALTSGVRDLKTVFDAAAMARSQGGQTLLFVDEIHRFNRAQLDSFLPVMENGTIILVGATTQNPSFELNAALLSRCEVLVLNPLDRAALIGLVKRAADAVGRSMAMGDDAAAVIADRADGDGRRAIALTEIVLSMLVQSDGGSAEVSLSPAIVAERLGMALARYDKDRDGHYDLISALHKSVRGSDPDAALYWFARMLEGGEDPLFIARRLIRMASEDIGLADPTALPSTIAARDAYQTLGSPEGELALAQAVIHVATAPKSNAAYTAYKAARKLAKDHGSLAPPSEIVNAPTKLLKDLGHGAGYVYDHDTPEGFSGQDYFPSRIGRRTLYEPTERGFERDLTKRLRYWQGLRERAKQQRD